MSNYTEIYENFSYNQDDGYFYFSNGRRSDFTLEDVKYLRDNTNHENVDFKVLSENSGLSEHIVKRVFNTLSVGGFDEWFDRNFEINGGVTLDDYFEETIENIGGNIEIHDGVHVEIHNHYSHDNKLKLKKIKLNSSSLSNWSKKVRERDGYVCRACGHHNPNTSKKPNKIEAHHLFPKSKYPVLAYDDGNGVALCQKCHKQYHNMYDGCETPQNFFRWVEDYKREGY